MMRWADRIPVIMRVVARPLVSNLPLVAVWTVALAAGAFGDIFKLGNLEHEENTLILGILRVFACSLGVSVLISYVLSLLARRRFVRWTLAFVAFAIIGFYLFLLMNYGTRLTPEIAAFVTGTNRVEATEYVVTYLLPALSSPYVVCALLLLGLWVVIDLKWQRRFKTWNPSVRVNAMASIVLAGAVAGTAGAFFSLGGSIALDAVSNTLYCYHHLKQTDDLTRNSIEATRQACASPITVGDDAPTVVLVIGESYIKSHASIYGYPLPTTPCLAREQEAGNLLVFNQVETPFNNTNRSLRNMLSLNSIADREHWEDMPLFPAIFKRAGFQVDIWDNQRELFSGSPFNRWLNAFIYHPEVVELCYSHLNGKNYDYDGPLIEDYMASEAYKGQAPGLVIFHLRGQHLRAENRYPHQAPFLRFTVNDYRYRTESFLTDDMRQEIAHYDNATLYNDAVLNQVFRAFEERDAVVVCLSDHGDEVYDYRPSIGRRADDHNQRLMRHYQFEIPFVVWCSPVFQQRHADQYRQMTTAIDRPFVIDNLGQVLMGLAGIHTTFYKPVRDLLSEDYKPGA